MFHKQFIAASLFLIACASSGAAANVTLTASDAFGASSFNSAGNWNNAAAPSATNAYFTGGYVLRTPADTVSRAFAGASLSVAAGSRLLGKTSGTTQILTVTNLILNGGNFEQATLDSDNLILTWAGSISVNAASGIGALGGTANGSSAFEILNITAPISGSAPLALAGSSVNGGQDSGVVRLSGANPYSGTITVSNGVTASTANGLLQLNHPGALSNATVVLNTPVANPMSFTASANTNPFLLGALAGTSSQVLADTAGAPITLNVGGNNASGGCSGTLSGAGALIKSGAGTLTLLGNNTYSGGTTVAAGTLQTARLNGPYSGGGTVLLMASNALAPQIAAPGASPFSGTWIVAGGWLQATNGALGTNSIVVDPQYPLDPSAGSAALAGQASLEPSYDLNSAGTLTLTNGGKMILHQNCAFAAVRVAGVGLAAGTHEYAELAADFPSSFPSGGAGFLTVQPYGTLPTPPAQPPQFLSQPVSQTNFSGMPVQFSASYYAAPAASCQWQCGPAGGGACTNLVNGGQFSGVTTAELSISAITAANAAEYVLVLSNASGSVTSAAARLTVLSGPAALTNGLGQSVAMAEDGTYSIVSASPAWTFTGTLGQAPLNLTAASGIDGVGGYTELQFLYSASVSHAAAIRLYANQPVILFTDTTLAAGTNDLAFPHLTSYPSNLYQASYASDQFAPPMFGALANESPWVLFDTNFNTFVLSPGTNYVIASNALNPDGSIACGVNAAIPALPAGFTHRTILTVQPGLNHALDTWGNVLTGLSGKARPANDAAVELNRLGYWTDNGTSYYYTYDSALGYQGTLLAAANEFAAKGVPLGYLQLDSWWYPKGVSDSWQGDATNNRGGVYLYQPDPTLFPNGLAAFQQQLGLPLLTHCRWIDGASPYRSQYAMSLNVIVDAGFWTQTMAFLKASGVATFEQDWLNVNSLPATNLNDPHAFMDDMAAAAASNGLNLQFCMELPRHYLQSSIYSNLLTLRGSIDRFDRTKWDSFLYCSRLAGAVGAWPWSDNFPSSESRSLLLSTLSAGPVGVGDALGAVNAGNLLKAVRPDGVIVKPDLPLEPLDQNYLNDAGGLNLPMVAATRVCNGTLCALYLFSYARNSANTNASFVPAALGVCGDAYVFDYFAQTGSVVSNGAAFSFATTTGTETAGGTFHVVVPIGPSGIAFLGDTNKFVTLGKKRISELSDTGVVNATVQFAAGETNVALAGYAPTAPYAWAVNGSVGGLNYNAATRWFSLNVGPGASASATVAVSLSTMPPSLQITSYKGNLQIAWPTSATNYGLQSAASLNPPANWAPATNPVTVSNDVNTVIVSPANPNQFFRLKK